jgi:hypothetical protein|tara:strand:- start:530 stop:967 length:438 start_codon:yes stop_codon:yes gene_type:complete
MWLSTLGDWDASDWQSTAGWSWSELGGGETRQPLLGLIIFALFTFVVVVVLLNLLIAILSETFDRVMESTTRVAMREKLAITMDVEASVRCFTFCCRDRFNAAYKAAWYPRVSIEVLHLHFEFFSRLFLSIPFLLSLFHTPACPR